MRLVYEYVFPGKKWCCADSYQTCLSSTCYNNLRSRLKFSVDPTSVLAARSSSNVQGKSKLIICFMFSLGQFSKYTIHAVSTAFKHVACVTCQRRSRSDFERVRAMQSRNTQDQVTRELKTISGALDKAF